MQISICLTADSARSPEEEEQIQAFSYEIKCDKPMLMNRQQIKKTVCEHIDTALQHLPKGLYESDVYSIVIVNPDKFFGRDPNANSKLLN